MEPTGQGGDEAIDRPPDCCIKTNGHEPESVKSCAAALHGRAGNFFDTVRGQTGTRPGKFRAGVLAEALMELQPFVCLGDMGDDLRWFDGRIWRSGGTLRLKELAVLALDQEYHDDPDREGHARVLGKYVDLVTVFGMRELDHQVRLKSQEWHDKWVTKSVELVPLLNGVLNVKTRELVPYDHRVHHFLSLVPVTYDDAATCPAFDAFVIDTVAGPHVQLVYELAGYCLWRDYTYKKAIMLTASGDNGKSVLLDVLETFLGRENISTVPLVQLAESRFSAAALKDKLANICADLPDRAVRETGMFKMLTGHDSLPYEQKFKDPGQFRSYAKLIFSANKIPDTRDDTEAYFSRWVIIEFPWQFVKEPVEKHQKKAREKGELTASMTTSKELSGLLNKALAALDGMRARNGFSYDLAGDALRKSYIKHANSLKAFIEDACVLEPDQYTICETFYEHYEAYCKVEGLSAKTANAVGREIREWHQISKRYAPRDASGERRRAYFGVRLISAMSTQEAEEQGLVAQRNLGAFNAPSSEAPAPAPVSPSEVVAAAPDNGHVAEMRAEAQAILDRLSDKYNGTVVQAALEFMLARKAGGDPCSAFHVRGNVAGITDDQRAELTALVDAEFVEMEHWVGVVHDLKKVRL